MHRIIDVVQAARRDIRKLRISIAQGGLSSTLYWAAFGYLRPNRFITLARDPADGRRPAVSPDLELAVWDAARLRRWRAARTGLRTEFFRDEIDGVERVSVALADGELAGLIWIYGEGDRSRLFHLGPGEAELNYGYVFPAFRARGAFRSVLAHACEHLRADGVHTVYGAVHETNRRSLRAFLGAGFHEAGSVRHFLFFRPRVSYTERVS